MNQVAMDDESHDILPQQYESVLSFTPRITNPQINLNCFKGIMDSPQSNNFLKQREGNEIIKSDLIRSKFLKEKGSIN